MAELKLQRTILRGAKPQRGRHGARMKPVDFAVTSEQLEKKTGHAPSPDEVLSYLMYPEVFVKFARARQTYGDIEVLPLTPQFF